jgi:hypothetical protein
MDPVTDIPEGISVFVVATVNEDLASLVGPMLAKRLYPDRRFGRVLLVEWLEPDADRPVGGYEVVVEDLGMASQ